MNDARQLPWKRVLIALLLFGTAFGYLEAAVVSYLRQLHEPTRQRFYPGRPPGDLFPLATLEQLRASGPAQTRTLAVEIGREAATLIMLAAAALAVAGNPAQWAAAFIVAFGVWDIAFYVFLKVILDWPASLFTNDILFLIPVPWVGPVLAPVIVSATMIAIGAWHLRKEARLEQVPIGPAPWAGIVGGGIIVVVSFAMDYRNIMAGGMPHRFNWEVFALGMLVGVASYAGSQMWQPREVRQLAAEADTDIA